MKTRTIWGAVALTMLAINAAAAEGEAAGTIKTSKGEVYIERAGGRIPGKVGAAVRVADKVRTGSGGSVGLTLREKTLLSTGPNSLLTLDKSSFDSTANAGTLSVGVRKGTLAVATGKIARQTPESIDFRTATSVIGVRGTEFVVEAGSGNED